MSDWPLAVLFDFDGIIVNSEPLHFLAFHETLAAEKIELGEEEYYRELIGFDDKGAFKHVYEKRGKILDPRTFLRVMTSKKERMMALIYARKYQALPGVEEFVRSLWRTIPLAICSGALREEIEAMLEGVALRDCFPVIVAAEDVTIGKPDPQGYKLAMKMLAERNKKNFTPPDCLIVEDAPSVIKTTRAAGFQVLGVATSYPIEKLGGANFAVKSLRPEEVRWQVPRLKGVLIP